jgi:N-acetyltransferase 10
MISTGYPNPENLELFYVNRDTLFSYHKASEAFLKKIMSIFVSSHYKNSPNDLQLISDAPSHGIFVLMNPLDKKDTSKKSIPDIFAAIQVCEEGSVSKNVILNNNKRGFKPAGDLIPWTISDFYQDNEFPNLNGIRIVRIATHPECSRMGYGTRAIELLTEFYEGKMVNLDENENRNLNENNEDKINEINYNKNKLNNLNNLFDEEIKPKKKLKPLLSKLYDIKPPKINYIGTAFGLTKELFGFWRKNDFYPFYIKMTENDITGEHSCILMKPLKDDEIKINMESIVKKENESNGKLKWLLPFYDDFKKRLLTLLGYEFKTLPINLALSILEPNLTSSTNTDIEDNNDLDVIEKENNKSLKLVRNFIIYYISKL